MITVTTTDLEEAREIALILGEHMARPYRILLGTREFTVASGLTREEIREAALKILQERSPQGMTIRRLGATLFTRTGARPSVTTLWRWMKAWEAAGLAGSLEHGLWASPPPRRKRS